MTLAQKLRSAFAVLTVFILVISTNQLDKQYYDSIKATMKSIFEDRLVAKGYLYDLNTQFYKKHVEILESDSLKSNPIVNEEINQLISNFETTALTDQEESRFKSFKRKWENLEELENQLSQNRPIDQSLIDQYCEAIVDLEVNLNELANIQIGEGESMIRSAQLSTDKNEFLSQIELILIIAIGVVIQFIIFYRFK